MSRSFPPPPVLSPPPPGTFHPTTSQARAASIFSAPPPPRAAPNGLDETKGCPGLAPAADISGFGFTRTHTFVSKPHPKGPEATLATDTSPQSLFAAESASELDEPFSIKSASDSDGETDGLERNQQQQKRRKRAFSYPDKQPEILDDEDTEYNNLRRKMRTRLRAGSVNAAFELEEISEYELTFTMKHLSVLRPSSIEEGVESDDEGNKRETKPRDFVEDMSKLRVDYDSESDLEEPEVREFRRRQKQIRRHSRLSHGTSIGKRPFSERGDDGLESLKAEYQARSYFTDEKQGERRTRRRLGEREGLQKGGILEVDEPGDEEGVRGFDHRLDSELPYHGLEIFEMEDDGKDDDVDDDMADDNDTAEGGVIVTMQEESEDDEPMERDDDNGVKLYPEE